MSLHGCKAWDFIPGSHQGPAQDLEPDCFRGSGWCVFGVPCSPSALHLCCTIKPPHQSARFDKENFGDHDGIRNVQNMNIAIGEHGKKNKGGKIKFRFTKIF
jgi:hypothetical protein